MKTFAWSPVRHAVNAGGKTYVCLRTTLCQCPGSLFNTLFECNDELSVLKDDNGALFLDVQPELFEMLLNDLRARR